MLRLMRNVFAVAICASVLAAAFNAYFVFTLNDQTGIMRDGFGRVVSEPPWWAFFITSENGWRGLFWHIADIIWFFGGLMMAYAVYDDRQP